MKVKTHIEGLDEMLNGGLIRNRNIVLHGQTGIGKTILGVQYLHNGATKNKEPGLYITLKEDRQDLIKDMAQLGFDLASLEKKNQIQIIGGKLANLKSYMKSVRANINHIMGEIEEVVKENNIRRVVIDSLNDFISLKDKEEEREVITKLFHKLSELGCTSILITEPNSISRVSEHRMEEFIADGIISLHKPKKPHNKHGIHIKKMRGSNHDKEPKLFEITQRGIVVHHKKKYL